RRYSVHPPLTLPSPMMRFIESRQIRIASWASHWTGFPAAPST
uniref:Uncharacterized protein n=1 Tax=Aegilops tauschii subsp. strangulata TaxID=200361 RepID=A0A453SFM9_AEGTS